MTGKKLVLVGLFTLATLVGAPGPAHAQWVDIMKWLSSLDPGPFDVFTVNVPLACRLKPGSAPAAARTASPAAAIGNWDAGPGCVTRGEGNRFFLTFVGGAGFTPHSNLVFANGKGPEDNITVVLLGVAPTYRFEKRPSANRAWGVDVGSFVGNTRFGGASRVFNKWTVQPSGMVFYRFIRDRTDIELATGFSGVIFPQGFTLDDFGAVSRVDPQPGQLDGKIEWLPAVTFIRVGFFFK